MKISLAGIEHQFIGEPTPRDIDAVIREQCGSTPIGRFAVAGIHAEELVAIYHANGWEPGIGSRYHVSVPIPSVECFDGLVELIQPGQKSLVGPDIIGGLIVPNSLSTWILR